MSAGSYTYTTISAGPGEPTRVDVSFHLDEDSQVSLTGAGTERPYLGICHGEVGVRICPRTTGITPADAAIARRIALEAGRYADEVERLSQAPGAAAA